MSMNFCPSGLAFHSSGQLSSATQSCLNEMANPLQYSCLENLMDKGAWWATAHGVAKSRTRLSDLTHSSNLST